MDLDMEQVRNYLRRAYGQDADSITRGQRTVWSWQDLISVIESMDIDVPRVRRERTVHLSTYGFECSTLVAAFVDRVAY